jgi:hypothetical protein
MSTQFQRSISHWRAVWIAVRFVVFDIGGFLAVFIGGVSLMASFDPYRSEFLRPALAIPLTFVAGLMMMFGGGVGGRWAYLWVVFSTPVVGVTMTAVDRHLPGRDRYVPLGKFLGVVVFGASMVISYFFVRRHYKRQQAPLANITESQEDSR